MVGDFVDKRGRIIIFGWMNCDLVCHHHSSILISECRGQ